MADETLSFSDVIREMRHTAIAAGSTIPMWRHALEAAEAKWRERDRQWEAAFNAGFMDGGGGAYDTFAEYRALCGAPEPLEEEN